VTPIRASPVLARRLPGSPASGGEGAVFVTEAVHPRSPVNAQTSTKLGANRPNCSRMSKQRIRELAALQCTIAEAAGVLDCHRDTIPETGYLFHTRLR